jgi:hypothetical protein
MMLTDRVVEAANNLLLTVCASIDIRQVPHCTPLVGMAVTAGHVPHPPNAAKDARIDCILDVTWAVVSGKATWAVVAYDCRGAHMLDVIT